MENPIAVLRERESKDRKRFARLLGISYFTLAYLELGYPKTLSGEVVRVLNRAGYDGQQLQESYRQWREEASESA